MKIYPWLLGFLALSSYGANCTTLGPVDGCDEGAWTCRANRPYTCSASRRWTPVQETCAPGSTCHENVPGLLHPSLAACVADDAGSLSSGGPQ